MRGAPRLQSKDAAAEIEFDFTVDQQRRCDDLNLTDQLVAHQSAERIEIELPACRQRARQVLVSDENRRLVRKCRIAEHMVRMRMRVDDVADRLRSHLSNRSQESLSLAHA